ncbi:hypothetical protein BJX70DRAFT_354000 [Aspergillus crustosus]
MMFRGVWGEARQWSGRWVWETLVCMGVVLPGGRSHQYYYCPFVSSMPLSSTRSITEADISCHIIDTSMPCLYIATIITTRGRNRQKQGVAGH